jgi:large subunit ribosomal protein L10
MREEKKYLVTEVGEYLDKSEYVFLADYNRITVAETAVLRESLRGLNAEYHVVKNSILKIAAAERGFEKLDDLLSGQTAIVSGGKEAAGVAKAMEKFFKDKDKLQIKGGVLDKRRLSASDVSALAQLPSAEILKAQFLALLNTPATQMVRIMQAVPQSLLYALNAKVEKEGASS